MPSAFCAPLTIEIDEGIEPTPFETGDVDQTISSSFVQTIDAADIRQTQLDLSQIIENNSGIKIRRIGGLGSYSQISIRGKSSDQVMVYLDGMLINNASGGSVDLSQVPINQIARIEIYKDVIPVEFSEASNGGVINIITHRTKKQKSSQFLVGLGSFDTYNVGINHFNHYKKWRFVFSGGYLNSKNNFLFNNEMNTPKDPSNDETQQRYNNQLSQYNFVAKANYTIDKYRSIHYQTEFFKKIKNLPSFSNNPETHASVTYNNENINIKYIDNLIRSNNIKWNFGIKASQKDTIFDDREKQVASIKQIVDQNTKTFDAKIYAKYQKKKYQIVSNSNIRYEKLSVNDILNPKTSRSNRRYTLSTALEGHIQSKNGKIIVSPAGRFFVSHDKFAGNVSNENSENSSLKKNYYTVSPQIGIRYQLWQQTSVKVNAGRYYRLPSYLELFGARGYIESDDSLVPEEGINLDAGFEHLAHPHSEILTKFLWNFSVYHSIIDNEIAYAFDARGIGKPTNNNKSTITGIENNINFEFNYDIELISNTTLQLPLNKSDPEDFKPLPGRSEFTQSTRLVFYKNPLELFIEHAWESSYYFDTEQRLPAKKKSIFNTGIKMHNQKTQISLTLNNIFDYEYKDYYSQVAPGFSIFLSTRFTFI